MQCQSAEIQNVSDSYNYSQTSKSLNILIAYFSPKNTITNSSYILKFVKTLNIGYVR